MRVFISPYAKRKYKKLIKKDKKIREKLDRAIEIFRMTPNHPSLRLHKLSSRKHEEWSITAEGNLRIIFQYIEDGVYIVDIGSHDEVY